MSVSEASNNVQETVLGSGISVQPSESDQLGFEPYVTAIAFFSLSTRSQSLGRKGRAECRSKHRSRK